MSSPTESRVTIVVEKDNGNTDDDDYDKSDEFDDNDVVKKANANANYDWPAKTGSSGMDTEESNVDEMATSKGMYRNPLYHTLESRVR